MRRVVRKNNFGGGNFLSLEFERSACTVGWTDIIGSIVGWLGSAARNGWIWDSRTVRGSTLSQVGSYGW